MTWPSSNVNTTNVDSGADSPASARTDFLDLLTKFNQLRAHVSTLGQTLLSRTTAALMRGDIGAAASGANNDITSLTALTTVPSVVSASISASVGAILVPGIKGAVKNLKLSSSGVSASVNVTADEIIVESAANAFQTLRGVSLSISGAASGANGLDTGTIAASTFYSVWVIWSGTTTAGLLSLSATAPTLPSGYTHSARVGWIRTDGTANKFPLPFKQFEKSFRYTPAAGTNLTALGVLAAGALGSTTSPTWSSVGLSSAVPSTASQVALSAHVGNGTVMVAPNNGYGAFNSLVNPPPVVVAISSGTFSTPFHLLLELPNIYYACDVTTGLLVLMGWEDNL